MHTIAHVNTIYIYATLLTLRLRVSVRLCVWVHIKVRECLCMAFFVCVCRFCMARTCLWFVLHAVYFSMQRTNPVKMVFFTPFSYEECNNTCWCICTHNQCNLYWRHASSRVHWFHHTHTLSFSTHGIKWSMMIKRYCVWKSIYTQSGMSGYSQRFWFVSSTNLFNWMKKEYHRMC